MDLAAIEKAIGYQFEDSSLLETAFTHPSYLNEYPEAGDNNQRFEFLGDAVLGMILAEAVFSEFPDEREGMLARSRGALARGAFLANIAIRLQIPGFLRMSRTERDAEGHNRQAALEDALEALIGAIFLDSDYPQTRAVVLEWFGDLQVLLASLIQQDNPKGRFQELLHKDDPGAEVIYQIIAESGPDHAKQFEVALEVGGKILGQGTGSSKKEAEEAAAREALAANQTR